MRTDTNAFSKNITKLLAAALLLGTVAVQSAQAQVKSDYEIKQNFTEQYAKLSKAIEQASEVEEINDLVQQVNEMDQEFNSHNKLLDQVLYPDTYRERMDELRQRAESAQERIQTITEQQSQLDQLTGKVTNYEGRLGNLSSRTDSLQKVIQQSKANERELNAMVRRYRNNLQERDEFIMNVVDSMFVTYSNLDLQSVKGMSESMNKARMNSDGNALHLIRAIASQNLQLLNSSDNLATQDYLRMYMVQQRFSQMWNRLDDKLLTIYASSKERDQIRGEINKSLADWNEKVSTQTWNTLNSAFAEAGIKLGNFADSEGFYNALTSYVDQGIKQSKEGGGQEASQKFQNFQSFWNNTVKADWANYLNDGDMLSYEQIAGVDQKLTQWETVAQPTDYTMYILLGIAVLIIVVLGVMLARSKSSSSQAPATAPKK